MRKQIRNIGFLLFMHWAVVAEAQQTEDGTVDSVVTVTEVSVSENADTTRFDPITTQEPFTGRQVPQRIIDSLKADGDYWYANVEPVKKEAVEKAKASSQEWFRQKWFRSLLWFVILSSFIGVVIWYLVSSNILIFRKTAKTIAAEEEEGVSMDDIFTIRYDQEIAKAAQNKNFRLAVRLWYLYSLKDLAEKGWIDYLHGRTNHDYVMQLHKSPYYQNFSRLTRNFEYTWYGQFELSADAYEIMRNDFINFKNALRR